MRPRTFGHRRAGQVSGTRSVVALAAAAMVLTGVAQAQTVPAAQTDTWYVQALGDAAFGNANSQAYGGEVGFTVMPNLQVFVEGGRVNNVAGAAIGAAAQLVVLALAQTQSNVGASVKEPVTFGVAGIRYLIPVTGTKLQPYVMGGIGIAKVKQDVKFTIGGIDVTAGLQQFGVQLGTDLSGDFTKAMLSLGGGVAVPVWERLVLDLHYRYGRIFAPDQGINVNRAGIGLGVRF
jgi:opacity protein-like surface antigen